jgi:hypothetical protein
MKVILYLIFSLIFTGCSSLHTKLFPFTPQTSNFRFNESHSGFEKESFLYAAEIAKVTYVKELLTARQLLMDAQFGMSCVDLISLPNTQRRVLLARSGNNLFISINGTQHTYDWYHDAKFLTWETINANDSNPYRDIPAGAAGFRRIFADMREQLTSAIKLSPCYKDINHTKVYYVGHSLGSALGIIAATVLCKDKIMCFSGMYLFAAPLVTGPEVFEKDSKAYPVDKIFVVQNYKDYIVRAGNRKSFKHPGKIYVLNNGEVLEFHRDDPYDRYSVLEKITFKIARDHPIDSYIEALRKLKSTDED